MALTHTPMISPPQREKLQGHSGWNDACLKEEAVSLTQGVQV